MKKEKKSVITLKEKVPKIKKPKSTQYVLRKNKGMKALRIILWVILIFLFIRGVVSCFKTDTEEQAIQMITEFKENYNDFTNQNTEIMSFAQNFVKEYLTYEIRGESDYKKRLQEYVGANILNSTNINDFSASAKAIYVQSYRIEAYSENQSDVYVLADVEYTSQTLADDGKTYITESSIKQMSLSVPIFHQNGKYIVESLPLVVTDSVQIDTYMVEEYYGTAISDVMSEKIEKSIDNFLKAYFEQDESVINYYLSTDADKDKFTGFHGRFTYAGMDSIKCYRDVGEDIICLVEFRIQDKENGVKMLQKINLFVQESGGKFYIESMGTRTGNLNIQ